MLLRRLALSALLALVVGVGCRQPGDRQGRSLSGSVLRLATTTSTRDSGLLDVIVPVFERRTGVRVDVVAAGTGKALKLGERGDVDALLVHAREAEDAFVAAGHGIRREDVMFNRFEIVGPASDDAGARGLGVFEALAAIREARQPFVSRGDDSGTHRREKSLWRRAGGLVPWDGYIESGQGMGPTLVMANQMGAYALTDRGTYLAFSAKVELAPVAANSPDLHNPYGAIVVNPAKNAGVNAKAAQEFVSFLVSPAGQHLIGSFHLHGEVAFHPRPARHAEP